MPFMEAMVKVSRGRGRGRGRGLGLGGDWVGAFQAMCTEMAVCLGAGRGRWMDVSGQGRGGR